MEVIQIKIGQDFSIPCEYVTVDDSEVETLVPLLTQYKARIQFRNADSNALILQLDSDASQITLADASPNLIMNFNAEVTKNIVPQKALYDILLKKIAGGDYEYANEVPANCEFVRQITLHY